MIEVAQLCKNYGKTQAVNNLSFVVQPGVVTGFLGPNGAGKTTTMRIILGLDKPTAGAVTVAGQKFVHSHAPLHTLGALLDAKSFDKRSTGRNHLRALGATIGANSKRVDEVLEMVGLAEVGKKRAGGYSLGMAQRLGIAGALLADPQIIMLDEPVNGLDPDGIAWIRGLLTWLAGQGRTVFVSSHLMSEMAQTAQHLIIIGQGELLADEPTATFLAKAGGATVQVRTPDGGKLVQALENFTVTEVDNGLYTVSGAQIDQVGHAAHVAGVELHELCTVNASLEEAFLSLTADDVQFRGDTTIGQAL